MVEGQVNPIISIIIDNNNNHESNYNSNCLLLLLLRMFYGRAGVRYVITKFSRLDSLPNFLTHGAPLRARDRASLLRGPDCKYRESADSCKIS